MRVKGVLDVANTGKVVLSRGNLGNPVTGGGRLGGGQSSSDLALHVLLLP